MQHSPALQKHDVARVIIELGKYLPAPPYSYNKQQHLCERDAIAARLLQLEDEAASIADEYACLYGRRMLLDFLMGFPAADLKVYIGTR